MKGKLTVIFILFSLIAIGSAVWQAYEASTLEERLLQIDRETKAARLLEESLPKVEEALADMLKAESAKLGLQAPFGKNHFPTPENGRAAFNRGFFLYAFEGLLTEEGATDFHNELTASPVILNTARRKADNPSAPILSSTTRTKRFDHKVNAPTNGVFFVDDPDSDEPSRQTGKPSPFFAWNYGNDIICMRSVPTNHGNAAEGFVIDQKALMDALLAYVDPGLPHPELAIPGKGEQPNLQALPLILRPGDDVAVPDAPGRAAAMRGTVVSAWLTSGLSILVLFGLLAFYARTERRRSDFVSAVTHELRTPLTTFNLYTEMLKQGDLPAEKVKEYHETLYKESRRLGHLVENVLSFARLSRGKVRGRMDRGTCGDLLPRLLDPVCERLRKAGFKADYTVDNRLPLLSLRTDISSVEQILTNLADNAIKYAESPSPAITIRAAQGHRTLLLRFADNGPGVAPELKSKLFEAFSRSSEAEKGRKPGVGLGLALSRDLARSIGGDLALEKSDDKGCTFLLTLPLGE